MKHMDDNMQDKNGVLVQGHIKIFDPETKEIYINKRNAIIRYMQYE